MRTGRWWMGASLGMALLLASYGLRAQERITTLPSTGGATFRASRACTLKPKGTPSRRAACAATAAGRCAK